MSHTEQQNTASLLLLCYTSKSPQFIAHILKVCTMTVSGNHIANLIKRGDIFLSSLGRSILCEEYFQTLEKKTGQKYSLSSRSETDLATQGRGEAIFPFPFPGYLPLYLAPLHLLTNIYIPCSQYRA